MKEISFDVPKEKEEVFEKMVSENLGQYLFKYVKDNKVYLLKDITTEEWEIVKVCEKICQMKD